MPRLHAKRTQTNPNRAATIGSGPHFADATGVTYLIAFGCYGCHLHGEDRGSVDKMHNMPGSRFVGSDPERLRAETKAMHQAPYIMDRTRREVVLKAILARCDQNGWMLLAAHVRTNHVHVVIHVEVAPERVMNDLKSYASRCLNQIGLDEPARKRWARHGSTRYLWEQGSCRRRSFTWWAAKAKRWQSSRLDRSLRSRAGADWHTSVQNTVCCATILTLCG
jgi:REP element-mobilizing transposase RayT